MKRFIFTLGMTVMLTIMLSSRTYAQSLVIGAKGPELKISEWVTSPSSTSGIPYLVEFFYSRSEPSVARLPVLDDLARKFGKKLGVIVIAREGRAAIEAIIKDKGYALSVALDDNGKSFSSYGVQFVPYSVLFDSKGRVVWFGNSTSLNESIITRSLGL